MEKLLKIEEVCNLFQVSRSTVYDWTHTGYIPHYKLSKGVRFKVSEIEKWLERKKKKVRKYDIVL